MIQIPPHSPPPTFCNKNYMADSNTSPPPQSVLQGTMEYFIVSLKQAFPYMKGKH